MKGTSECSNELLDCTKYREFLGQLRTVSFSRRTLLHIAVAVAVAVAAVYCRAGNSTHTCHVKYIPGSQK
jgi:hypothetical protein